MFFAFGFVLYSSHPVHNQVFKCERDSTFVYLWSQTIWRPAASEGGRGGAGDFSKQHMSEQLMIQSDRSARERQIFACNATTKTVCLRVFLGL